MLGERYKVLEEALYMVEDLMTLTVFLLKPEKCHGLPEFPAERIRRKRANCSIWKSERVTRSQLGIRS